MTIMFEVVEIIYQYSYQFVGSKYVYYEQTLVITSHHIKLIHKWETPKKFVYVSSYFVISTALSLEDALGRRDQIKCQF